jgi:hypothetical protein
MAHEHNLLLPNAAQVFDQSRDVGHIVGQPGKTKAVKRTRQPKFEHGKTQVCMSFQCLCDGPGVWNRVRAIA